MDEISFPVYFKCTNKAQFDSLNSEAAQILGTDIYQQPLIDSSGKYWLIVNSEVSSLVNLEACVEFENIVFPSNDLEK
jgi:hypothetical protein